MELSTEDHRSFEEAYTEIARKATEDAVTEWYSKAVELLYARGDEHEYEVFPVAQASMPPEWDTSEEAWVFTFPHVAAAIFEFGAVPHEIEAKNAEYLAFEWPDAPPEIQEQFSATFPKVFFQKVDHPGVEALHYVTDSWKQVFQGGGPK